MPANHPVEPTPLARCCGLGAIHPAKRSGLLAIRQPPTFRQLWRPATPPAPQGGRTRIAWHLPRAAVLHPPDARQRRS